MSDDNGANPVTDFDLLAEQIGEQYDRLIAEREPLKARLDEINADVRRLERMLVIARPEAQEQAAPQAKPKNGKGKGRTRVSQATMDRVLKYMEQHDPSPYRGFDRVVIAEGTGVSESAVSYALKQLRETEQVRLVGKKPREPGQHGIAPLLYGVMPNG